MLIDNFSDDVGEEDKTAILVMSCKKFEQVWDPFFTLFKRFWPECPYQIYFGIDSGEYNDKSIKIIKTGKDIGWGNICLNAIDSIPSERILLFQEDFLLKKKTDNSKIRRFVKYAHTNDIGCLRLCPCPGPTLSHSGTESLGVIGPNDEYRVSLQLAIWKKSVLRNLIFTGDGVRDVEILGSKRVKNINEPFLSIWRESENIPGGPIPYVITAVVNGKWHIDGINLLKKENIPMKNITLEIK